MVKKTKVKLQEEISPVEMIPQSIRFKAKNQRQKEYYELIKEKEITFCSGAAGVGKSYVSFAIGLELVKNKNNGFKRLIVCTPAVEADEKIGFLPGPQPLDCKILTPTGWVEMGDIKVGDRVIGDDGKPANVIGVYPKGVKPVYEILTTNGGRTKACGDHLWSTRTHNENKHNYDWCVRSTLEIMNTIHNPNKGPRENHFLPKSDIVEFDNNYELPIKPYVLGVLLGDGSFSNNISFASIDSDIVKRVESEISDMGLHLTDSDKNITYNIRGDYENNKPAKSIKITNLENNEVKIYDRIGEALKVLNIKRCALHDRCVRNVEIDGFKYEFINDTARWRNDIKNEIHGLGLEGTKALTKFIPNIYKYTSIENRIALLQGLMDTDGTIKKSTGEHSFTTISKQLCDDVVELCRSLGSNATFYTRNRIGHQTIYKGRILETKHISYEVSIPKFKNINPFHLKRKADRVINKNMFKQHNKIKEINYIGEEEVQCIMLDNQSHLYITDDYIVTHNTIEEKLEPYLASSVSLIDRIVTKQVREDLVHKGIIEFEALGFIRGKTFHDCILVCEEAQNMSPKQMKTLITRIGENAKFIISGDIEQSDRYRNGKESGLSDAIRKFADIEEIGVFEFSPEDIVRNPIISKMLKKYEVEDVKPKNEFVNTSGNTTTDIFGFKQHQDPSKWEPRSVVDKPKRFNYDGPFKPLVEESFILVGNKDTENKSLFGKLFG